MTHSFISTVSYKVAYSVMQKKLESKLNAFKSF